jgi:NAD(P)H-hydrate epimerase
MPERVPAYSAAQVRDAEEPLLEIEAPLMARAAGALARVGAELLPAGSRGRVLVLAGRGNNGGDALFAAEELQTTADCDILLTATTVHEDGFAAAVAAGARVVSRDDAVAASYDLILDGILGIGTSVDPSLRGPAREIVAALRGTTATVVAVDVPSGLHPDSGTTSDDIVLPASVTVTFGALKSGLIRGRGPELAGRIVLVDIGLRDALTAVRPVEWGEVERIIRG